MENEIMVSINCLVYNHEEYLRKCLDGLLMQKTNFEYEILINDDASTDGSADIIREYERRYPEIIKPIYQTENQHSLGKSMSRTFQYPRAQGKYVAWCEGDDYWTDENKLQLQVDALENNKNCNFCAHNVAIFNELSQKFEGGYPSISLNTGVFSGEKILDYLLIDKLYIFQTSSFLCRKDILLESLNTNFLKKCATSINTMIYFASKGDFYFIDETMSCYRHFSKNSFSMLQKDKTNKVKHKKKWINSRIELKDYLKQYYGDKYSKVIDDEILNDEFLINRLSENYKACLSKKYKAIYRKLSIKERIFIILNAFKKGK